MACTSVISSTPLSVTAAFPETASLSASLSKTFSASEASVAKCSATSEETVKPEGSRTSESSGKSVPTSGFMTTDFQAKFLEFSQRKAAGVAVGQTAAIDDPEAAGSTGSMKVKKTDVLATPSTLKKSSPVAEDSIDSVEMKPSECHSSSSESQQELPITSLPMQVDGCCDSSDDAAEESDSETTVPYSSYSVDAHYLDFVNEEEPELVEIWRSSVGLQVDGAADDETDDVKEGEKESTSNNDGQVVTDDQLQLSNEPEAETAAGAASDAGVGTTVTAAEVLVSGYSVCDSVVASVSSSESLRPNEHKPVDVLVSVDTTKRSHLLADVSSSANRDMIEDSESRIIATPHLPSDVNMRESVSEPSTSELPPSVPKICHVPDGTTAPVQCMQSNTSQTLECTSTGEAPVDTTAAVPSSAPSVVSELQSLSASEAAPSVATANSTALHLELMSQNSSIASDGDVVPYRQTMNQPFMTTEASATSLSSAIVPSVSCTLTASVISSCETIQSGVSSQCLTVASTVGSECSAVSTSSQVVESYSVSASAVAVDPTAMFSVQGTSAAIVPSTSVITTTLTSHVDSGNNVSTMNPAFNGSFQLRPEMPHASMQQFMGNPPRRIYLPAEFQMQHRMMQRGMPPSEGMMIPPEQLPHGPPPPYPNKQYAGPQTFWVRQQHPSSGIPPEWIRHSGDFGHRPLPPNVGSHEWSRPQMMPAEWSGRQRMPQEWVYFQQQQQQQPHHPSQAPHQWVRSPYSNMPGFQLGTADGASMQADAYNSGYQPIPRNTATSAAVAQDPQVAQGIKSPGSTTPRPSSHPSESPVPASPASARLDMGSPPSRSHTPRSMSRSSTPQGPLSGTSGMSHTPDHVSLPAATAASPHLLAATPLATVSTMPTSSPVEQSSLPSSSYQAADHMVTLSSDTPRSAVGDLTSASVSGLVSAPETGTSQPSLAVMSGTHVDNPAIPAAQLGAFSQAPTENMIYMHRPPRGMPMSSEMRRMALPAGGQYIAPPSQGMYMPGHAGPGTSGMAFYRMPSSAATTHSAIGALLNQQRAPVGMSVHYPSVTQPPGAPVAESRYQLIHTQDVYLSHPQRHIHSSAVTVAGPSASGAGSFVLQHQQRGQAPSLPAESAGHMEVPNHTSVLPNSMQAPQMLRGPFRMPQQLGPGAMPMGMRVAGGSATPVVYGPQRPVPPSQVRMIAATEMRPQMIHMPRSSVTEFAGPAYRPRPPGEQPLLLEDLLEQVCYVQFCEVSYRKTSNIIWMLLKFCSFRLQAGN